MIERDEIDLEAMRDGFEVNDEGNCPVCGSSNVEYGNIEIDGCFDDGTPSAFYPVECKDCGKSGREWYALQYAHTEYIPDGE